MDNNKIIREIINTCNIVLPDDNNELFLVGVFHPTENKFGVIISFGNIEELQNSFEEYFRCGRQVALIDFSELQNFFNNNIFEQNSNNLDFINNKKHSNYYYMFFSSIQEIISLEEKIINTRL